MLDLLVKYLDGRGYSADVSMAPHIDTWESWYKGYVEDFHTYTVYNGIQNVEVRRSSLQLAKGVCERLANLLFNEKCGIAIDHEPTDAYVKEVFDANDIYVKINEGQEKKAAFGTICYIPYYTRQGIRFNFITARHMIPMSWENGYISELCVYSSTTVDSREHMFVQLFYTEDNGEYTIENLLFEAGEGEAAFRQVDFTAIPGYEDVEPIVRTKSTVRPFVVDRLNIVNNVDFDSPLGIAVFANAIDAMQMCDTVFDSYGNEFILGKKRIMVATEAINVENGRPVFDPNELVFYKLPGGAGLEDKPYVQELGSDLRVDGHQQALQQALDLVSTQCGLGESFFKRSGYSTKTATEVISENSTLYSTLKKHEIILESVIVDLVRLVVDIGRRYDLAGGLNPDAEVTVTFDDSIIEDKGQEIQRRMGEVSAGLLRPEIYLAWRYGVTEEEALKMMPDMPAANAHDEGMP